MAVFFKVAAVSFVPSWFVEAQGEEGVGSMYGRVNARHIHALYAGQEKGVDHLPPDDENFLRFP